MRYYLLLGILSFVLLLSNSCSEMGRQPPEWGSAVFTPDGKYLVYLYKIFNVTYYERAGGMEHRAGKTNYYLQVMDCSTGKLLLHKVVPFGEHATIIDVDDQYVWIETKHRVKEEWQNDILLFDLNTLKMKFEIGQLRHLNPAVPLDEVSYHINATGYQGLVCQAADGRYYLISAEIGKFLVMKNEPLDRIEGKNNDTYQLATSTPYVSFNGSPRATIVVGDGLRNGLLESANDYLQPQVICVDKRYSREKVVETRFEDSFFIIEPALKNSSTEHIVSRIERATLQPVWRKTIRQELTDRDGLVKNKFRFHLKEKKLCIVNAKSLYVIDVDNGDIIREVPLFAQ